MIWMRFGVFALCLVAVPGVSAQQELVPLPTAQVIDATALHGKLTALARAIPEELYDWRPMEGVRSFREVFGLLIAEAAAVPHTFGVQPPDWYAGSFSGEVDRAAGLPRAELIDSIDRAFARFRQILATMDDEQSRRPGSFIGNPVEARTAMILSAMDIHEHLGQLVAYSRMNGIVPPWSR